MRCVNRCLLILGACFWLNGCGARGEPLCTVPGQVVFQGKPVSGAVIIFHSADGRTSIQAPLAEDGKFRVGTFDQKGLPPGTYRVSIKPTSSAGGAIPLAGMEKEPGTSRPHPLIPARFHDPQTSQLKAEVRAGVDLWFAFDLGR